MPKKEIGHHQIQGGVTHLLRWFSQSISSITHRPENVSQSVTRFLVATKSSQHFLTQTVQFVQSRIMLHVDKVYASFWRRIARRDAGQGYTTTAEIAPAIAPTPNVPYLTGHEHGTAYLPFYCIPDFVEQEQVAYERSLSYDEQTEYRRGYIHGFSGQAPQPDRVVAA